jgi:hypothetical protein
VMGGPLAGVACPSLPDVPGQHETSRAGLPNTFCILAQQLLSVGETPAAFWRCRNRALGARPHGVAQQAEQLKTDTASIKPLFAGITGQKTEYLPANADKREIACDDRHRESRMAPPQRR